MLPQSNWCILLLLLVVAGLASTPDLPGKLVGNTSIPLPGGKDKVRPFRRAGEVQEFTTAAADLKTTILTLQLYYIWAYLKCRASCVHTDMFVSYKMQDLLETVCNNLVNNHITNKAKRLKEVSNAMQHLKTLLEAYSCVTRGIADSDNLCCYLSRCEVAPRAKQCLNILNATALHNIAEDVLNGMNFIQLIGNEFGASFDCRMPSNLD